MFETLKRWRVLLIGLTRARRGRGLNNISSRIGPKASEVDKSTSVGYANSTAVVDIHRVLMFLPNIFAHKSREFFDGCEHRASQLIYRFIIRFSIQITKQALHIIAKQPGDSDVKSCQPTFSRLSSPLNLCWIDNATSSVFRWDVSSRYTRTKKWSGSLRRGADTLRRL